MGVISSKSAEEKNYWKAFKGALEAPLEYFFTELECACEAWPDNWHGYMLMGLSYDLAAGMKFDPEKGREYHQKAKEAAKAFNNKIAARFYDMYEASPVNFRVENYYPRTEKVRQLGPAILFSYNPDEVHIMKTGIFTGIFRDDLDFWSTLLMHVDTGGIFGKSDEQRQVYNFLKPFRDYIDAYQYCKSNGKGYTSSYLFKECFKVEKVKNEDVNSSTVDMWPFVSGFSFWMGVPYIYPDGLQIDSKVTAWRYFWVSASMGCSCAVRFICTLWFDPRCHDDILSGGSLAFGGYKGGITERTLQMQICRYAFLAGEKGDRECASFYYKLAKQFGV